MQESKAVDSKELSLITSEERSEESQESMERLKQSKITAQVPTINDQNEYEEQGVWAKAAALKSPRIRTNSKDSKGSRESSLSRPDAPQYDPTKQNQG